MAASDKLAELEFAAQLDRELKKESVYAVARLAADMMRLGKRMQSLACALCNRWKDQGQYDLAKERIDKKIGALLAETKIGFETGGDPRGYTVVLALPSGVSNSFSGKGYGVPGS